MQHMQRHCRLDHGKVILLAQLRQDDLPPCCSTVSMLMLMANKYRLGDNDNCWKQEPEGPVLQRKKK
jgi:hypothetical protein